MNRLLMLMLAMTFALAASAQAQTWPQKPVRLVVPQAPGGASDALARVIGQHLGEKWGQPVVVENRAGAGGNIGTEAVAKSPADGYTLLLGYVGTHAINVSLYSALGYDPVKDFAPVATLATVPFALAVNSASTAQDLRAFLAQAKVAPGNVGYGSAGTGSVNHLLGEMVNAAAGVKLLHVPYKGAAAALNDLLGGQVQAAFGSLPSLAGHVRSGRLRVLGVTSAKRSPSFPEIPTLAESGLAGFDVNPWFGILAPAGTAEAVVRKINADINEALRSKDVVEKFGAAGAEPFASTPEQFSEQLKGDIAKWARVVRESGAKAD
ncbi:MAG TPA: tripartite tricarboxylate transporter substrate binding protein [Casimicrobiaceae bacterium]|nr:tripartite tricarboxylate transporter substrate binding protein [Casimicrobiaceae bacterium]